MTVPTLDELHRPVLEITGSADQRLTRKQILEELISVFSLTDSDIQEMVPSGAQSRIENRTNWAMTDLKKAGLIDNPQRNQWEITSDGRSYLGGHPGTIKFAELQSLWSESSEIEKVEASSSVDISTNTPDEIMDRSFQLLQSQLTDEVLDSVKGVSPESFERLVNRLLAHMGYGEIDRETGHSGDQGIDGILNQDTLGLEKVYVQAKRYTTGQVGEPDIRNFSGSLVAKGATKGVFITTTSFGTSARQTAQTISMGNQFIRLIDGKELAELMITHGVGVVTEITYEVKKLDANYFASELALISDLGRAESHRQVPSLEELLAQVPLDNHPSELDFGSPQGKEVW